MTHPKPSAILADAAEYRGLCSVEAAISLCSPTEHHENHAHWYLWLLLGRVRTHRFVTRYRHTLRAASSLAYGEGE